MEPNKQLSIVIPTYNRADFLDYSLETHIPMVEKYNIQIFVSDNASTDNISEIMKKWMAKYQHLHYSRNETNIGPDANFEKALKMPDTEYVWLLGDTYRIQDGVIGYILGLIENDKFDHILINVGNEIKDFETQIYNNQNKLLEEMFWLMTCLSVHIYSNSIINNANFSRYRNSNFIQTGIIFEYLDNRSFKISWTKEYSVERILSVNGITKDLWINKYFEIWVNNRINTIMSLPPSYKIKSKLKAIQYDDERKKIGTKLVLGLRAKGILNFIDVKLNKDLLILSSSFFIYYFSIMVSLIPESIVIVIRKLYKIMKHLKTKLSSAGKYAKK